MSTASRLVNTVWTVACALALALFLTGCVGQGNAENTNAEAAATAFMGAVSADPVAACALLAPQTLRDLESSSGPCPQALAAELRPAADPARSVQVYGTDAIVHLGAETIFLARFPNGWRVTAAGCTRQVDRPYDCSVKGG